MSKKKEAKIKETVSQTETKLVKDMDRSAIWKDKVCPAAIEFTRDSFILDKAHCAIYTIYNFPSEVGLKWLRPISLMKNTMICMYAEKGNKSKLISDIDFTIHELQMKVAEKAQTQITAAVDATADVDRAIALSQRLSQQNIGVIDMCIYIYVYAESPEELKTVSQDVEGILAGNRMIPRRVPFMQEQGFDAFMPVMKNTYKELTSLAIPADAFYVGMGFVPSFGINDPTGLFLGFDLSSNPIFLDVWSKVNGRTNSNIAIMGKSGSGKSATTKDLLIHELSAGTRLFILDPEREYLSMARKYGGNVINPSGGINKDGTRSIINPLQLTHWPEAFDEFTYEEIVELSKRDPAFKGSVTSKISQLKAWFATYLPVLNDAHIALIEKALYETYKRKGLSEVSNPATLKNEDNPTMSDLGEVLKEWQKEATPGSMERNLYDEIMVQMYSVLEGTDRAIFNGHTNVDLSNPLNVFDVSDLIQEKDNIKNAQFNNLTAYLWLAMTRNREERAILEVDEAHLFINEKSTATFEFLGQLCKRARKYEAALWVTTQNIGDFLHPSVERYGAGILDNCSMRLVMKSESTDIQKLTKLFDLNEGEQTHIKHAQRGQGLLIAGDMKIFTTILIEDSVLNDVVRVGGGN